MQVPQVQVVVLTCFPSSWYRSWKRQSCFRLPHDLLHSSRVGKQSLVSVDTSLVSYDTALRSKAQPSCRKTQLSCRKHSSRVEGHSSRVREHSTRVGKHSSRVREHSSRVRRHSSGVGGHSPRVKGLQVPYSFSGVIHHRWCQLPPPLSGRWRQRYERAETCPVFEINENRL